MVYLYFDQKLKRLYLYTNPAYMWSSFAYAAVWKDVENVAADKERGQICAHVINKGIVAEFPIEHTVLTCQQPEK